MRDRQRCKESNLVSIMVEAIDCSSVQVFADNKASYPPDCTKGVSATGHKGHGRHFSQLFQNREPATGFYPQLT
jgi:hypothetical protein